MLLVELDSRVGMLGWVRSRGFDDRGLSQLLLGLLSRLTVVLELTVGGG